MQRSPGEGITRPLAREIARREQLKALVAGSIGSLGRNYVIARGDQRRDWRRDGARAGRSGRQGRGADVTRRGDIKLREKLGESLASVHQFDVPLARATTPSLDALQAYALALEGGVEVPPLEGIPQLKRAIELDPALLWPTQSCLARTEHGAVGTGADVFATSLRTAGQSERTRTVLYFMALLPRCAQDWDKGLELAQSWTILSEGASAFNSLGFAAFASGSSSRQSRRFASPSGLIPGSSRVYGKSFRIAALSLPVR